MKKIALTFILLITMGQSYGHEDKFLIEEVASFDQPWSMAFLPDGNFLVTEKPGKMFLMNQAGETLSEMISLEASVRPNVGKGAARAARRQQLVPGIIYGAGASPQALTVKFNELFKLLKAGKFKSTLIELKLGDKSEKVICRDVQKK